MPKPMPIPFDYNSDSVRVRNNAQPFGVGFNFLDSAIDEETAKEQKTIFPNSEYVGSGVDGIATECYPGIICKYVDNENEAATAEDILQNPCKGTVKIYGVQRIQSKPAVWLILSEKIKILSQQEQKIWNAIHSTAQDDFYGDITTENNQKRLINQIITPQTNEFFVLLQHYINLSISLNTCKLSMFDAHGKNVGYNRNNEIVLLDLGHSSSSLDHPSSS